VWSRVARLLRAAIGDDGTGAVWPRLTAEGQEIIRLAFAEARALGHPCIADEHRLMGLLRHGDNEAAALLRARGLDLDAARDGLLRVGPALGSDASAAGALQAIGIDAADIRQRARQLDYSRVPAWVRQDSERAARMAKQQMEERDRAGQSGPPAMGHDAVRHGGWPCGRLLQDVRAPAASTTAPGPPGASVPARQEVGLMADDLRRCARWSRRQPVAPPRRHSLLISRPG